MSALSPTLGRNELRPPAGPEGARAIRIAVVGEPFFLDRHAGLLEALRKRVRAVDRIPLVDRPLLHAARFALGEVLRGAAWTPSPGTLRRLRDRFEKDPATFVRRSRISERMLAAATQKPDLVVQIGSLWSPNLSGSALPYAHYIDVTTAMVRRYWPQWLPYDRDATLEAWLSLEGASYRGAFRVFTFTRAARDSLIRDYGVDPERVATVGTAGHYGPTSMETRSYGGRRIIFNGSEFERKGGDLVLAAFRMLRERVPDAALRIVGTRNVPPQQGVDVLGNVSRDVLYRVMAESDVVLAPSRFEGIPGFVLEAMHYGAVPILSDAVGMSEIITDGDEGFIVSPTTVDRLVDRVEAVLRDPALARRLGSAARRRIARYMDWDAVVDRMLRSATCPAQ
jgi:glycogen(starch) synthase